MKLSWPRTLQGRLTAGYSIAFFAGLVGFAIISYAALDAALRAVIDAPLRVTEGTISTMLADDAQVDHPARLRLGRAVGSTLNGAVFSSDGRAVYSSVVTIDPSIRAEVLRAGDLPRMTVIAENGNADRLVTHRVSTGGGRYAFVGVWRPLNLVEDLKHLFIAILAAAILLIGGTSLVVGRLVAREGLKPLAAVATLASEIEAHDLSRRLGMHTDDSELGRLATTFDRMLERLDAAFERQRRFAADASHELRAPLSVIHVAADLALRREREPSAYRRVLTSILGATQQLEGLTDRLLTAARVDAGQLQIERIDLSVVVRDVLQQFAPLAEQKSVTFISQLESAAFANVDRPGILRAVVAIVDNALKYSPPGGTLTVAVSEAHGAVQLTIRDDGPGFSADGLTHAMDRFWRDDQARARGGGAGLGLAICNSIVRACGGTLGLENAAGHGGLVRMEFPSAG